jgi:hypothetical protein
MQIKSHSDFICMKRDCVAFIQRGILLSGWRSTLGTTSQKCQAQKKKRLAGVLAAQPPHTQKRLSIFLYNEQYSEFKTIDH